LNGRYSLLEQIGRGATGTVFRAWDGERTVAIKELPLLRHESAKSQELLTREARVLQSLDHPRVPRCHDHFVLGQGRSRAFYLVQDFNDGQTLAHELDQGVFSEAQVLVVMSEVLQILVDLHGRNPPILHRDLKPANLIRRRSDGRLVLLDFGAVRDVLRDSKLGGSTVAGTFGFMAPEQFQGDAWPAADLYGLGAMAVNLLTGKDPARLHGWDGRFTWQEHAKPSPGLTALLKRLLAPDPNRRMSSAAAALASVLQIQAGKSRWQDRLDGRQSPVVTMLLAVRS
jgi:serine/threonine protein kinase